MSGSTVTCPPLPSRRTLAAASLPIDAVSWCLVVCSRPMTTSADSFSLPPASHSIVHRLLAGASRRPRYVCPSPPLSSRLPRLLSFAPGQSWISCFWLDLLLRKSVTRGGQVCLPARRGSEEVYSYSMDTDRRRPALCPALHHARHHEPSSGAHTSQVVVEGNGGGRKVVKDNCDGSMTHTHTRGPVTHLLTALLRPGTAPRARGTEV